MEETKKALICLSGGLDSAVLLTKMIKEYNTVEAVSFYYGSKHGSREIECARKICSHFEINHKVIMINNLFEHLGIVSSLLLSGGNIPEGHYHNLNMTQTVVPGRNGIMIMHMAAMAQSNGFDVIALGVHSGDHFIYPDCRPEFINSIGKAIWHQSEGKVDLISPFIYMDKSDIVKIGLQLMAPMHLTRTCYKDQDKACGRCGSCVERLEAFEKNGVVDPIEYERKAIK